MALTVLHVVSGDLWAGAEVMVYNLLRTLQERATTRVLALALNEGTLTEKLRAAGVATTVIAERERSFPRIVLEAAVGYRGAGIRIIHTHRYKEHAIGVLLSRLLGVRPLVATMHGMPEGAGRGRSDWGGFSLKTRGTHALLRTRYQRIVLVSGEMEAALVGAGIFPRERVTVIHNGIEIPPEAAGMAGTAPDQSLRVGTVGRLVPVKDLGLFLEVAAAVRRRRSNVRFAILGDGSLRVSLRERAASLGIAADVEFLPSRPDPLPFYRSLAIYLNTSRHEGIPLSILEAMACGLPVVAPRTGGIPEIIQGPGEGFLVKTRAPEDFAEPLVRLVDSDRLREDVGRRARERAADSFSREQMGAAYETLYKGLAG